MSWMTGPGRSAVTCLGNRTKHPFFVEEIMCTPPPHSDLTRTVLALAPRGTFTEPDQSYIWLLGLLVPHPVVVGRDDVAGRVDRDNA